MHRKENHFSNASHRLKFSPKPLNNNPQQMGQKKDKKKEKADHMLGLPFFTGINQKLKDVMRLTISGYFLTTTMSRQPTRPPWGCRVDRGTHSGVGHPWYPSLAAAGAGRVELPNTFRWRPAHICTGRRWWVSKQVKCVLTSTYCQTNSVTSRTEWKLTSLQSLGQQDRRIYCTSFYAF